MYIFVCITVYIIFIVFLALLEIYACTTVYIIFIVSSMTGKYSLRC